MLQAFFNGLSGLFSFSKGLDNVSNNVSNMNTPGFRGTSTFYRSVGGGTQDGGGYGSEIAGVTLRTAAGELRQTGNETDLAIKGRGYFILKDADGNMHFTRSGQFMLDKDNVLVESVSGYKLNGYDSAGNLTSIDMTALKTMAPKPTTKIDLSGNLVIGSATHNIAAVQFYDATGAQLNLSLTFTNTSTTTSTNTWKVEVGYQGTTVSQGEIRFSPDGSPMAGFNTLTTILTSNGQSQNIVLDFGTPGSLSKATQLTGTGSNLTARATDGAPLAGLTTFSFDESGVMKLTYSTGEKKDGQQVVLADFADESALLQGEKSLYDAPKNMSAQIGKPNSVQFGKIQGGYIELSNVDLSQEFGDILIIQRGYQASSRVMTVANEMLDQLYNTTRGG
ncbi:flagellar hook protein FlgE [Fluviicoccus keumensis]|uniref:Flagellar basal-body rod protein FlgF n=1 Tax=Fluviicoccus keumensis TaxID=1435465 RepID=A0A4Q7YP81_9GAMM|nr:flagellar basal-body rod protein FlgF [Fluviicoccus keumensis]RZU38495.1 flagellar hook protein FlgE [Fluviicoccus keumensis]